MTGASGTVAGRIAKVTAAQESDVVVVKFVQAAGSSARVSNTWTRLPLSMLLTTGT